MHICTECHKTFVHPLFNLTRGNIFKQLCNYCYMATLKNKPEVYLAWKNKVKKKCKKCGKLIYANEKYFKLDNKGEHGLHDVCRYCESVSAKVNAHIRRGRVKDTEINYKAYYWSMALKYFGNKCAYCGERQDVYHQEHIVPVSKGGGYTKENIIPACHRCNESKNNKDIEEWYPNQKFFDVERYNKIKKWNSMK